MCTSKRSSLRIVLEGRSKSAGKAKENGEKKQAAE
jgi:hypothetical protein